MDQIEQTIAMVRQLNPQLAIGGIVVTMVDRRTSLNGMVEAARAPLRRPSVHDHIPFNVKSSRRRRPGSRIAVYAAESAGRGPTGARRGSGGAMASKLFEALIKAKEFAGVATIERGVGYTLGQMLAIAAMQDNGGTRRATG